MENGHQMTPLMLNVFVQKFKYPFLYTLMHTQSTFLIKNTAKNCNIMINFSILTYCIAVMANILFTSIFIRKMYYSWMHQIDQSDIY